MGSRWPQLCKPALASEAGGAGWPRVEVQGVTDSSLEQIGQNPSFTASEHSTPQALASPGQAPDNPGSRSMRQGDQELRVFLAWPGSCALTPLCYSGREPGTGIGLLLPRLFDQIERKKSKLSISQVRG